MDNNTILVLVFGVLALYFYSSMSVYKSMYRKIKEEKELEEKAKQNRDAEIRKYEAQLQDAVNTIQATDDNLVKLREEMQRVKLQNSELKHRNELLQKRVDELYSSVGMI